VWFSVIILVFVWYNLPIRKNASLGRVVSMDDFRRLVLSTSCTSAIRVILDRIENNDNYTNAVVEVRDREDIFKDALRIDESSKKGALLCTPVIVKDNIAVKGMKNAAGSLFLERMVPVDTVDAKVIKQIKRAGGIIVAKANMDEFALDYHSLSTRGGQTRNFFDHTRYPGGSSGGCAVSVASGFSALAVGTDTGGSVRIPASFAGLVGIRPATGLVSTDRVVPLSHSRDVVGFMGNSVFDVATILGVSTNRDYKACLRRREKKRARLHVLAFMFPEKNSEQGVVFEKTLKRLASDPRVELVHVGQESALNKQFKSLLKQKSSSSYEFHHDIDRYFANLTDLVSIFTGTDCSRVTRKQCNEILHKIQKKMNFAASKKDFSKEQLEKALLREHADAFIYPTFTKLPTKIKQGKQEFCGNNRIAPVVGWPALTLPAGVSEKQKLPQGLEILSKTECRLFGISALVENILNDTLRLSVQATA